MEYGARVRRYREARDMTQDELARLAGIPSTSISRIEHGGRSIKLEEAVNIAQVFGIPLTELAGIDPQPTRLVPSFDKALQKLRALADELDALAAH